jgi:hypothetical protein
MNEIGFEREKRAAAEEMRRERREFRREETHKVRHATAEVNLQLKQLRFLAVTAANPGLFDVPQDPITHKKAA